MTRTAETRASDALHTAVRRWPSDSARLEAERLVDELCSDQRVDAVVVFGSAVRNTARSFDLDLLYFYHGDRPGISASTMEVDLRGYPRDKASELVARGHDLICWSLKFGRLVCDRAGFWGQLQSEWLLSPCLPSPADAESRARKAWKLFADLLSVGDYDAALEQYVAYLTHVARKALIESGAYPASRPELPGQLRQIGARALAEDLEHALRRRNLVAHGHEYRIPQFLLAAHRHRRRFNGG